MKHIIFIFTLTLLALTSCVDDKESRPELSTQSISNIEETSAIGSGYITVGDPEKFKQRGICWSLNPLPTVADNTAEWTGDAKKQDFKVALNGLTTLTSYYVRAYVSDGKNTYYGNELSFTTRPAPGTAWCVIDNIYRILPSGASVDMEIADNGSEPILELGLCYGMNPMPTVADNTVVSDKTGNKFSTQVSQLMQNTHYFVRPYFRTESGIIYGDQKTFTTLNFIVTGDVYIGYKTAYLFGEVVDDAGSETSERGVCWGTSSDVTIETAISHAKVGKGKGVFNNLINGLTKGAKYYSRAYAVNDDGTFYGNATEFTTKTGSALPGTTLTDMKIVEAGTFTMGYAPGDAGTISVLWKGNAFLKEITHQVTLTEDYYFNCYETTNEQVCAFLNSFPVNKAGDYNMSLIPPGWKLYDNGTSNRFSFIRPGGAGGDPSLYIPVAGKDRRPAANITYTLCYEYCRWLSAELEVEVRMPTEAEWEYAARGGKLSSGYTYAGSDTAADVAVRTSATLGPNDVGSLAPNELGLYDMSGNVFEICADVYTDDVAKIYYDGVVDPCWDPSPENLNQANRIFRGGSFRHFNANNTKDYQVLGRRGQITGAGESGNLSGFRIVMMELPASLD